MRVELGLPVVLWSPDPARPWQVAAAVILCAIVISDLGHRRVPNALAAIAIAYGWLFWGTFANSRGMTFASLGLLSGLALGLVPYCAGLCGAADAKCFAALSGWLGWPKNLTMLLLTALAGGLLSLLYVPAAGGRGALRGALARARAEKATVPYTLAIVAGMLGVQQGISLW